MDTEKDIEIVYTKPDLVVRVLPGSMEATLQIQATGPTTSPPERFDIAAKLKENNITYGINWELIDELCVRPSYYTVFAIARGEQPTKGEDGYIEYLFRADESRKPKINADGTADYKNIDFIRVAEQGQVLCRIHQAKQGEDGHDIHGVKLAGQYGREPLNPTGKNTTLNYDGSELIAEMDGRIKVNFGIVNIAETLMLESVDNSTGNVEFKGDVIIRGDVAPGFFIKSKGSIAINGSVEGATILADEDIRVSSGIFGMRKGKIEAGGDIKCKFIQNSDVTVNGNVYADSVLYSDIRCKGDMILSGSKGTLVGGRSYVAGKLVAKSIGNDPYTLTDIYIVPNAKDRPKEMDKLEKLIRDLNKEEQDLLEALAKIDQLRQHGRITPDQKAQSLADNKRCGECIKEREQATARLEELRRQRDKEARENSYVECAKEMYPQTVIHMGSAALEITEVLKRSKIHMTEHGIEIKRS